MKQILPLSALLVGTAFLFFAGGINGLVLPVRGAAEGFSELSLGLLGTGWAIGYVLGCIYVPGLVAKVGHIRPFGVMATTASLSILLSSLFVDPISWIALRALAGFAFAGAAMIIESWLSEQSNPGSRGRVFGVYTMVNLLAVTAGQLSLAAGSAAGFHFFILAAIFYNLALIPTAISSSATPKPLHASKLDIGALWRNSPVAVVAVFLVGTSNSSFNTLAAVFGQKTGMEIGAIAMFVSAPILAGAIAQIPVGILSDKVDRRYVLLGVTAVAIVSELVFIFAPATSPLMTIVLGGIFGAAIFALYPVIVAHANDHAEPGTFIRTSGGLLLLFGLGSIIGPLITGLVMAVVGPRGLFVATLGSHVLIIAFTLIRIRQRAPVEAVEKSTFVMNSPSRATPETIAMAASESESDQELEQPPD